MKKVTDCGISEKWNIGISPYIASTKTSMLYTPKINARVEFSFDIFFCNTFEGSDMGIM